MITSKQLEDIKKILLPILKEKSIKTIWISNYDESSNSLKMNILVDDTLGEENSIKTIRNVLANISTKAASQGIVFMPIRKLSKFLDLLKNGDQLAISTLSSVILLYDPAGYIRILNSMVHKGKIYGSEERALKLFEKAKEKFSQANSIVSKEITFEAYMAMIESAQAALLYAGKHPGTPENMVNDITKFFSNVVNKEDVDNLKEASLMMERVQKDPKTYDSSEIDKLVNKSKDFTKHMQDTVSRFESESDDHLIEETLRQAVKKCSELLNIPITSESDIINSFKKRFLEHGLVSQHHHMTLLNLYQYSHANKKERLALMRSKFLDRTHLHSLKVALEELSN